MGRSHENQDSALAFFESTAQVIYSEFPKVITICVCSHNFADRGISPLLELCLGTWELFRNFPNFQKPGCKLSPTELFKPSKSPCVPELEVVAAGGSCCSADRFQLDGCSGKWQNVTEPRLCRRTGFNSLLCACVQLGC